MLRHIQIESKRDYAKEKEAQEWIEAIADLKFNESQNYEQNLRNGIILCKWAPEWPGLDDLGKTYCGEEKLKALLINVKKKYLQKNLTSTKMVYSLGAVYLALLKKRKC